MPDSTNLITCFLSLYSLDFKYCRANFSIIWDTSTQSICPLGSFSNLAKNLWYLSGCAPPPNSAAYSGFFNLLISFIITLSVISATRKFFSFCSRSAKEAATFSSKYIPKLSFLSAISLINL